VGFVDSTQEVLPVFCNNCPHLHLQCLSKKRRHGAGKMEMGHWTLDRQRICYRQFEFVPLSIPPLMTQSFFQYPSHPSNKYIFHFAFRASFPPEICVGNIQMFGWEII
jgi:hypothetical protein